MKKISRRDFIKIAGVAAGALASRDYSFVGSKNDLPCIIVIVMDTLSARHMSLHGYSRLTTPNIDAFASSSTVYRNHYSGSNFTTTGTASMLTGMLPWKHRAINYGGLIQRKQTSVNPFSLIGDEYVRLAFTQNTWADHLLGQMSDQVDEFLSPLSYSMIEGSRIMRTFDHDRYLSSIAITDYLLSMEGLGGVSPGSSVVGYINRSKVLNHSNALRNSSYPKGLPEAMSGIPYKNEEVYAGIGKEILRLNANRQGFLSYFHLYSPHFPYRPRNDFKKLFNDQFTPPSKAVHPYSFNLSEEYINTRRTLYDRLVAQIDEEFGKLLMSLKESGVMDNSYVIVTSDHGELFERGYFGHAGYLMYEGVLHIPLIIHEPGQTQGQEIHALTSNTDLLPTLLSIAGKEIPSVIDGRPLPGFGGNVDEDRSIISMVGVDNSAFAPIKKAVFSIRKKEYKLIAYLGYDEIDRHFELYDLEDDPEELTDLSEKIPQTLLALKDELYSYLDDANKDFMRQQRE